MIQKFTPAKLRSQFLYFSLVPVVAYYGYFFIILTLFDFFSSPNDNLGGALVALVMARGLSYVVLAAVLYGLAFAWHRNRPLILRPIESFAVVVFALLPLFLRIQELPRITSSTQLSLVISLAASYILIFLFFTIYVALHKNRLWSLGAMVVLSVMFTFVGGAYIEQRFETVSTDLRVSRNRELAERTLYLPSEDRPAFRYESFTYFPYQTDPFFQFRYSSDDGGVFLVDVRNLDSWFDPPTNCAETLSASRQEPVPCELVHTTDDGRELWRRFDAQRARMTPDGVREFPLYYVGMDDQVVHFHRGSTDLSLGQAIEFTELLQPISIDELVERDPVSAQSFYGRLERAY